MARRIPKPDLEVDAEAWLRNLPKVELHLHLEGTVVAETLVKLSERHATEPLTLASAKQLYTYADFLGFLMAFKAVSELLRTPGDYELITYEMVRALAAQGVVHAEVYISFGILHRQARLAIDDVMLAIERGRTRGETDFGTSVFWLIDAVRHFGAEEAGTVFRLAAAMRDFYPSIVGIGIGGDEARGAAENFRELYAEARASGLRLTAHAGESTGPSSIWSAINIGAERIGHALSAKDDPDLMEVLAERQIPLEMNVTSNIRTGCCPDFDAHPVKEYFEAGLMVTLNSDDPPMFGSDLLGEYMLAFERYGFTLDQMRELAANSVEASFLEPERKVALLQQVEQYGW